VQPLATLCISILISASNLITAQSVTILLSPLYTSQHYTTLNHNALYSTTPHHTTQDEEAAERMDIGGGGPSSKDKANMSAKEIDELLKRGAYDVFREDDSDQREFEEADIDSILERRARKVDLSAGGSGMSASLGEIKDDDMNGCCCHSLPYCILAASAYFFCSSL
jgi:hypothetical protein